jgi:hypothetical protein
MAYFPVVKALQPANAGGLDAFVARIRLGENENDVPGRSLESNPTASPSISLSPSRGAATAEVKKQGTASQNAAPLKFRSYPGSLARRVRPGR